MIVLVLSVRSVQWWWEWMAESHRTDATPPWQLRVADTERGHGPKSDVTWGTRGGAAVGCCC